MRWTVLCWLSVAVLLQGTAMGAGWTMVVDGQNPSTEVQVFQFYPKQITINAGDTLVFLWGSIAPAIVTVAPSIPATFAVDPATGRFAFSNSLITPSSSNIINDTNGFWTSGLVSPIPPAAMPTWNVTFTAVGTYTVWNALQTKISGTIVVQPTGSPYPTTQAAIDAATAALLVDQAKYWDYAKAYYKLDRTLPYSQPHPNGVNTIWSIWTAYGDFWNGYSIFRFFPDTIKINRGDVLVFNNADRDLHIVVLGDENTFPPLFTFDPTPPTMLYITGPYVVGVPGPYTGTGFVTSGLMVPSVAPGSTSYSWNVTMNAVGTFALQCPIHGPLGMVATITVT